MHFSAVMVNHFLFLLRYLILASAFRLARLRYVLIFISEVKVQFDQVSLDGLSAYLFFYYLFL